MINQGEIWDSIIGSLCFVLVFPNLIQAYTDYKKPKRNKLGLNKLIHNVLWITALLLATGSFVMTDYERYPRLAAVSYSFNEIAAGIYTFALTQICLNALRSLYAYVEVNRPMPAWQVWGLWGLNALCVIFWIMAMLCMTLANKPTSWKSGSYFTNACVLFALCSLLIFSKWTLRDAEAQIRAAQRKPQEPDLPWYKRKPDSVIMLIFITGALVGWIGFQTWRIWTHKESYSSYDTKKYAIITAVMARAIGLWIVGVTTFFIWDSAQVDVVFPRLSRFTRQTAVYFRLSVNQSTLTPPTSSRSEKAHPTPSQFRRPLHENHRDSERKSETEPTPNKDIDIDVLKEKEIEKEIEKENENDNEKENEKENENERESVVHENGDRVSVEMQTPASKSTDTSPDKGGHVEEKQPLCESAQQTHIVIEEDAGDDHSVDGSHKRLYATTVSSSTAHISADMGLISPTTQEMSSPDASPTSQRSSRHTDTYLSTPRSSDESASSN